MLPFLRGYINCNLAKVTKVIIDLVNGIHRGTAVVCAINCVSLKDVQYLRVPIKNYMCHGKHGLFGHRLVVTFQCPHTNQPSYAQFGDKMTDLAVESQKSRGKQVNHGFL